ncbi:hypothetical protein V8G54_023088 [Vigna mungo]|uniref:Subtilisin-like protease SBT5.3 n=1 Tax=Vigna mungo TaxID=3915 RepID=A0AAQ3RQ01_VIGMU
MRLPSSTIQLLCQILLVCLLNRPSFAVKKSYVVYLGAHSHGPELSSSFVDFNQVTQSHYEFLGSYLRSPNTAKDSIFYSYTRHINGFAATLEEEVAAEIAKHPKVLSVFENRGRKLHTTRSWEFMGLEHKGLIPSDSIWKKARFGEGVIIGNLDTVGPLNSSFQSPRDKEGHGSHTLSTAAGNAVPGVSVFGQGFGTAKGGAPKARVAAYKVCWPPVADDECFDADILAAFDEAIHDGVDVLSVSLGGSASSLLNDSVAIGSFHAANRGIVVVCSAGNSGPADASVSNLAPWHVTVAASTMDREFPAYVVLGDNITLKDPGKTILTFDSAAATDSTTHHKIGLVDLHAGQYVLHGPTLNGASCVHSFQFTIATHCCQQQHLAQSLRSIMFLLDLKGESLSAARLAHKLYPIIKATDAKLDSARTEDALLCQNGTLDPNKVKGKIVICLRGINARVDKGEQALLAGAVGMVLANNKASGNEIIADPHPDVTAPGVSVIAAYTKAQGPTNQVFDKRRISYNSVSGTSMSCPHVSGIAALLRASYPSWTTNKLRICPPLLSATTLDNEVEPLLNATDGMATPLSYGAGHVQPNIAMDPGLVYDTTIGDYLNFLCALGYNGTQISVFTEGSSYVCRKKFSLLNLNYPSITVPNLSGSVTVTRTLKNVGSPSTYIAHVHNPNGITVSVKPSILKFTNVGEEKRFKVTFKIVKGKATNNYVFGKLIWSDGRHYVRSPIVVKALTSRN